MSFFKSKTIIIRVRDVSLTFNMITKADYDNFKYYGKINKQDLENNPELVQEASDEVTELLASKIVAKDGEDIPTAKDLNDLTNDELNNLIQKVSGSSESIKQSLNRR